MGLADKLEATRNGDPGKITGCGLGRLIKTLPAEESKAILDAIQTIKETRSSRPLACYGGATSKWLHAALREEGYDISWVVVNKHVSERCSCGPR
jgi:hypothetical protein